MTDRRIEVVAEAVAQGAVEDEPWLDGDDEGTFWTRIVLRALDADWVAHLDELVEAGAEALGNVTDDYADNTARLVLSAAHRRWTEGANDG